MIRLGLVLIIAANFVTADIEYKTNFILRNDEPEVGYRLPNDTIPVRYDLHLTSHIHLNDEDNPKTFEFEGKVGILIKVVIPTSAITLQARNMTIHSAVLRDEGSTGQVIRQWVDGSEIKYNETYEFLVFEVEQPFTMDQHVYLEIEYSGTLRDLVGFYKSSYLTKTGVKKWLATTQFESTEARHAFPCYDEPAIRAPIGLTLVHGRVYSAVSNMPVVSRTVDGDYATTVFKDTPSMPTYLLAFVISDFTYVGVQSDPPQRVFGRREAIDNGDADFALRAGVRIMETIDQLFGVNYTEHHEKIDQFAIPDFDAGAMENWGLVTYREEYLLWNKQATIFYKHEVADTIAHEYTHFLFGNLVSIKWWSQLWLKEGFATLYGKLAVEPNYPELDADDYFFIENYQRAMSYEELGFGRPMTLYKESPEDIDDLFDIIAYPKAASVLRMLKYAMTDEAWHLGLNYYLTNMTDKAADSDDLAHYLDEGIKKSGYFLTKFLTMKDVIDSWALQEGFPVVTIRLSSYSYYEIFIEHEEFKLSDKAPRAFKTSQDGYYPPKKGRWIIPVEFATKSVPNPELTPINFMDFTWLTVGSEKKMLWRDKMQEGDWVIANPRATGYYRVNYDQTLWQRLIDQLQSGSFNDIHQQSRAKLVDDAFALAKAERLNYSTVFDLLKYMKHEKHFLPWVTADPGFLYLDRLLTDTAIHAPFRDFVKDLITPLYREKGIYDKGNTETMGDKLARSTAVAWACRNGDATCLKEANSRVREAITNTHVDIEPNLRGELYCAGIRQASEDDFVALWKRMQDSTDGVERRNLISALGCTENVEQQNIYLNSTIESGTTYRQGERDRVFQAVYTGSSKGVMTAIDFLGQRAAEIQTSYGSSMFNRVTQLARYVTSEFLQRSFTESLEKIEKDGLLKADEKEAALAVAQINHQWLIDNENELYMYFNSSSVVKLTGLWISFTTLVLCLFR